jgi:hypothetical protein
VVLVGFTTDRRYFEGALFVIIWLINNTDVILAARVG